MSKMQTTNNETTRTYKVTAQKTNVDSLIGPNGNDKINIKTKRKYSWLRQGAELVQNDT